MVGLEAILESPVANSPALFAFASAGNAEAGPLEVVEADDRAEDELEPGIALAFGTSGPCVVALEDPPECVEAKAEPALSSITAQTTNTIGSSHTDFRPGKADILLSNHRIRYNYVRHVPGQRIYGGIPPQGAPGDRRARGKRTQVLVRPRRPRPTEPTELTLSGLLRPMKR